MTSRLHTARLCVDCIPVGDALHCVAWKGMCKGRVSADQRRLCSYGFTWDGKNNKPNLGDYYLTLGDQVHSVCKSCIFLLEGTGQSNFLGVDW